MKGESGKTTIMSMNMVITGVICFIDKLIIIIVIYIKLYQHNDITWGYIRRSAYIFSLPCILEIFNLHPHPQEVFVEVSWASKPSQPAPLHPSLVWGIQIAHMRSFDLSFLNFQVIHLPISNRGQNYAKHFIGKHSQPQAVLYGLQISN